MTLSLRGKAVSVNLGCAPTPSIVPKPPCRAKPDDIRPHRYPFLRPHPCPDPESRLPMSTWRALPGMALGAMVEIREHRSPLCWLTGHSWVWETDTVACSVPRCRATNRPAMQAILDEFASPHGAEVLARELKRRAGS